MSFIDKFKKSAKDAPESASKESVENTDSIPAESGSAELDYRIKKLHDILDILQIPATFDIPANVFLPSDLESVEFDIQVPHGYDEGQVIRFVEQTRQSIAHLTSLLLQRNADVAKIASVVDKLQVDLNNERLESEIAQGVSIMSGDGDTDLETQLLHEQLRTKELSEKIVALESKLSSHESSDTSGDNKELEEKCEKLSQEVNELRKRNEELEVQVAHAKSSAAATELSAPPIVEIEEVALPLSDDSDSSVMLPPLSDSDYRRIGIDDAPEVSLPSLESLGAVVQENSEKTFIDDGDDDEDLEELLKRLRTEIGDS